MRAGTTSASGARRPRTSSTSIVASNTSIVSFMGVLTRTASSRASGRGSLHIIPVSTTSTSDAVADIIVRAIATIDIGRTNMASIVSIISVVATGTDRPAHIEQPVSQSGRR